jgi:hypothetical protein
MIIFYCLDLQTVLPHSPLIYFFKPSIFKRMKHCYFLFIAVLLSTSSFAAKYSTPNTGVRWTLADLVANSGGTITFDGSAYNVSDTLTISANDTLDITDNAIVKFAAPAYLHILGVFYTAPPDGVLFTAQNIATPFKGIWMQLNTGSRLKKLTLEYANALKLTDCLDLIIDSCIFRRNTPLSSFANDAITLFRSSPLIKNSQFLDNGRAAISGGANIANAPVIINNIFMGNNTSNANVPQINLGSSGTDTVKILNNQLLRASTNSGGIGFLPIGDVRAVISGNIIRNNRYGVTFNGGANINSIVSYNIIDSNNTQNNPALGGSGISFTGGSASSQQNSIVTGNVFRFNLWGITIQGRSKPNLGNTNNADTSDNGKNYFINNTNATTPGINLYDNSPDPITAQNNYWGSDDPVAVEASIFHQPDNGTLGLVDYSGYIVLPVTLTSFTATVQQEKVLLNWQTATESNSDFFSIERSYDGQAFEQIGTLTASGNSSSLRNYHYIDGSFSSQVIYYRIKQVDRDGHYAYSAVVSVRIKGRSSVQIEQFYPTVAGISQPLQVKMNSDKATPVTVQLFNPEGKLISQRVQALAAGNNNFSVPVPTSAAGTYYIRFTGEGFSAIKSIIRQ